MIKSNFSVYLIFLVFTLILRSLSFFLSVIDTDESLYLLMANSLLDGDVLYTSIWDHKPPGIYLIFAFAKLIFQDSIFSIRFFSCLFIASSAFILYLFSKRILNGGGLMDYIPGLFYILFSLNNGGLAANTEIFFTPFVIYAFLRLYSHFQIETDISIKNLIVIGIILGIGLQIKYIVLFDYLAILIILLIYYYYTLQERKSLIKKLFVNYITISFFFFLPFILIMVYFLAIDHFDIYLYSNFKPNIVNSTNTTFSFLVFLESFYDYFLSNTLLCVGGIIAFAFLLKLRMPKEERFVVIGLFVWLAFTFLGVGFTKRFYNHYYLQTLPPLCILSGFVFQKITSAHVSKVVRYSLIALLTIPSFIYITLPLFKWETEIIYHRHVLNEEYWGDTPAKIASFINNHRDSVGYIYVANYQPIVYDLTDSKIPTKYVFFYFLINEHFATVAGVNSISELQSILSKNPQYVIHNPVKDENKFYPVLRKRLREEYDLIKIIDEIEVYIPKK